MYLSDSFLGTFLKSSKIKESRFTMYKKAEHIFLGPEIHFLQRTCICIGQKLSVVVELISRGLAAQLLLQARRKKQAQRSWHVSQLFFFLFRTPQMSVRGAPLPPLPPPLQSVAVQQTSASASVQEINMFERANSCHVLLDSRAANSWTSVTEFWA
jgi:hypothetical protein